MSKSPNLFHPEIPNALGSRSSSAQEFRDLQAEVNQVLEEEANKVIHHLTAKLPKDALDRLDVMGGLKEKLYNYFNQNFQNMFNRYTVTTEDEMVKKFKDFMDREENYVLTRYSPREIARLLNDIGGADSFNTGEIEKSVVNMYGQLQGHIQRGINELESHTNSLLRQKTDVGAFTRGELAYSVIKCTFKDNIAKPNTVLDLKLSVNILDSELISPIFHYQVTVDYLVKDLISKHIMNTIDNTIDEKLSDNEILFSKLGKVEEFTADEKEEARARRYKMVSKAIMTRISGLRADIEPDDYDPISIRENVKKIVDIENVRNRGFNRAVNSIASILDSSRMGYQRIENLKNAREVLIREYEDSDAKNLPDERYELKLKYLDNDQLIEERKAYDLQIKSFEAEIQRVWDTVRAIFENSKTPGKPKGFEDLAGNVRDKINKLKLMRGEPIYEDINKVWDEVSFVKAAETKVEGSNRSYIYEKDKIRNMIIRIRQILKSMYAYNYPTERSKIEDRLGFLEQEFIRFEHMINPYHVQPGLVLDIDITSVKKKKATLNGMAKVLEEFLQSVSKDFSRPSFDGNSQSVKNH